MTHEWSNGNRWHVFDTRPDTESKLECGLVRGPGRWAAAIARRLEGTRAQLGVDASTNGGVRPWRGVIRRACEIGCGFIYTIMCVLLWSNRS
jgi:hypothetical protein